MEPNWDFALKHPRPTDTAPSPLFIGSTNPNPNTDPNTNPRETEKEQASNPPPEEATAPQYTPYIASGDMLEFVRLLNGLQSFLCAKGYKVELLDVTRFTSELRRFLDDCEKVSLP